MGLRREVKRLKELASSHLQTLCLKDGTEVPYTFGDMLGALSAQLRGKDYPLLPAARKADPSSSSMSGLIQALAKSQQRRAEGRREEH